MMTSPEPLVPMPVWWAIWFMFGACVGSFLNVCIYRMPRDQSIVRPRSRCPRCRRMIAWYDNIPLLSFIALAAHCRHCRKPIHWRYPLVEALSGALTVAVLSRFGITPVGLIYAAFALSLVAVSFIDIDFQIIPDEISLGGLVVGVVASALVPSLHGGSTVMQALGRSLLGAFVGGGVLYATGALGTLMFRKEAMGGGDIKLLAMAGSILGWKAVMLTFFLAPLLALGPGIVVLLFRRSHVIPYGPFLSIALLVALFAGPQILALSGAEETLSMLWSYYRWGS